MRKVYKLGFLLFTAMTFSVSLLAQNSFFSDLGANRVMPTTGSREIIPETFRTFSVNVNPLKDFLWSLPKESSIIYNRNLAPVMSIPMPNGGVSRFRVWESSVQEPGLEAKFPEIKTFLGQGIDDPYATIRLDFNPYFGFSAQILSPNGRIMIDPYARRDVNTIISYYMRDYNGPTSFNCEMNEMPAEQIRTEAGPCLGTNLRTFRLAFAVTGEFSLAVGGGLAGPTHAAIVTGVNRLTQVYEDELAVRLVLIANNNLIEYLDPTTDPWANNGSIAELNAITGIINAAVGSSNYDIGHLGCTASNAGVAGLGVVCGSSKGRGLTGGLNPVGDPYYIDYVAHEMGHQFNAPHTFNSNQCASTGGSYEPGGGTTIMAYAGICAANENIQPNSDPIFHAQSFDAIGTFISSGGGSLCADVTATGNTLPQITSMTDNNLSIPINTPFVLNATATDANGDAITYNWEGWDVGPAGTWISAGGTTNRPLFRTRVSKTTGERTFPDIRVIAANYPGLATPSAMNGLRGEVLPTVARTMKFRLTVRDNRAGGGGVVSSGDGCQSTTIFQVNAVGTTPFAVTVPNGGESYPATSTQTITWNNANTTAAPFNVANVRITLSTDGGLTYPNVIIANTPNDGSESVTIPNVPATTTARVRVEAIGNIFFDISNQNFSITAAPSGFSFNSPAPVVATCPTSGSMQTTITATYNGVFNNPITLSASGNPAGTTVSFGTNPLTTSSTSSTVTLNNTGSLAPGNYTITILGVATGAPNQSRDITFTINPGAGPAITGHPSNQTICANGNTSFSVTSASATGFQWEVSTNGGGSWSNVTNGGVYSGATTNTLTLTNVPGTFNDYRYRAVASVQCGTSTSAPATLTVNTPAVVTTHPQNITLCAGSNHTFTSAATGSSLTYQWEESTNGGGTWNPISNGGIYSGATSASLTLTGITAGMNNYQYRNVITAGGACPGSVNTNAATLSVVTSVAITSQPINTTVCAGANASFTVAGSGAGIIYVWEVSTNGGGSWTTVTNGGVYSGATTATLTITGATVAMNGYQYRAKLSNSTCTNPGTSDPATLNVNSLPAVTSHPNNSTICLGGNTSFTAAGTGTGVAYQWQVSTNGGGSWTNVTNGGVYAGATTATLTITGATAAMNTYQYRAVISGTCAPSVNTNAAILTVVNPVSITDQPDPVVMCSEGNTSFSVATSSTEAQTYQWEFSVNGGTTWNSVPNGTLPGSTATASGATTATLSLNNVPASVNGVLVRVRVNNVTCTTPTVSNTALLTVRQLPTVGLSASSTSLLPGQLSTLTATPSASGGGTLTTQWLYNGNPITVAGNTYVAGVEEIGTYQVTIQESYTGPTLVCSNQSPVVTITAPASTRLFIFPTPNDGTFTVSYYNNGSSSTSRRIVIFDSKGSQVYDRKFNIVGPYTLLDIDLRSRGRGIYYVVVGDASGNKLADGKVHVR